MSFWSRMRHRLAGLKPRGATNITMGPLREFVYLDEVSVYSILASRMGGIAAEFTERKTATLNSEIRGSLSAGIGGIGTKLDSKLGANHVEGSQVLRKAVIQTSFKELYDIECESLVLTSHESESPPTIRGMADLEARLRRAAPNDGWLVDHGAIRRGGVMEVSVELDADTIFRMVSIISTFKELMENNETLFGNVDVAQIAEMGSIARVLEGLLVGLVPIRGRVVDYQAAAVAGREVLIHRSLLEQMPHGEQPETYPVFVVGVTERELFWKDIRRLLFAGARYTIFGRIGRDGLADAWHPIKIADVLSGLAPGFDEMVGQFSAKAEQAFNAGYKSAAVPSRSHDELGNVAVRAYAKMLIQHHGCTVNSKVMEDSTRGVTLHEGWSDSVDGQRTVFGEVTRRVEGALGVETPRETVYQLRQAAMEKARAANEDASEGSLEHEWPSATKPSERFVDTEVIAIYW